MALFFFVIMNMIHSVISYSKNCGGSSYGACSGSISCTDNESCSITCNGPAGCDNVVINVGAATSLSFNSYGAYYSSGLTINCGSSGNCLAICHTANACQGLTMHGQTSAWTYYASEGEDLSVTIYCEMTTSCDLHGDVASDSLEGVTVYANDISDVSISCNIVSCFSLLTLDCGGGNSCSVDPMTMNSCTFNSVCDSAASPTTSNPTTFNPTTSNPTTSKPTTFNPTTSNPTVSPMTATPTTFTPTTFNPTTSSPTTSIPTTSNPTTTLPSTFEPTTSDPTTFNPTLTPTTSMPTTFDPTTDVPTGAPSTLNEGEQQQTAANTESGRENKAEINNESAMDMVIVILIVAILICVLVIVICLLCYYYKHQKRGKKMNEHNDVELMQKMSSMSANSINSDNDVVKDIDIGIVQSEPNTNSNGKTKGETNVNSQINDCESDNGSNDLLREGDQDESDYEENDTMYMPGNTNGNITKGNMDEMYAKENSTKGNDDDIDDGDLMYGSGNATKQ